MNCRICHRHLSAPKSLAIGMGPVCSRKNKIQLDLFKKEIHHKVSGVFKGDIVLQRDKNGSPIVNIEQSEMCHSPDGFEWGYAGSGPAELALNILLRFTSRKDAYYFHQEFKQDFIVDMSDEGGIIEGNKIKEWLGYKIRLQELKEDSNVRTIS